MFCKKLSWTGGQPQNNYLTFRTPLGGKWELRNLTWASFRGLCTQRGLKARGRPHLKDLHTFNAVKRMILNRLDTSEVQFQHTVAWIRAALQRRIPPQNFNTVRWRTGPRKRIPIHAIHHHHQHHQQWREQQCLPSETEFAQPKTQMTLTNGAPDRRMRQKEKH